MSDTCIRCGAAPGPTTFLAPLHGEKGGPAMCVTCGTRWYADHARRKREQEYRLSGVFGAMPTELSLELLTAALALTHPDMHPPERKERAQRVTAELSALKPFVLPKPPPAETAARQEKGGPINEALQKTAKLNATYPCESCRFEIPMYFCDSCRATWEACDAEKREKESAKVRERRARKRANWRAVCAACGEGFRPSRRDAKYCCAAHRQLAHRQLHVTDNQSGAAETPPSRHEGAAS